MKQKSGAESTAEKD
ncbi:Protein CBG26573 [Caenorhabditis briggsae]|uniref:Protein CBG26573 n=1 Tax=Caenorhabditis briggsae TaxID=6238 RepID=B6IE89_CAEBR|nr:Protein CBG26573 [Caenorhabditis briggsae]CAS01153.1 Protein CBG26573 [Caenorhabditis briggsae]